MFLNIFLKCKTVEYLTKIICIKLTNYCIFVSLLINQFKPSRITVKRYIMTKKDFTVIEFCLMQVSDSDSQTSFVRYEAYEDEEDVTYALERAYERCNYISSVEDVATLTGESVEVVAANFAAGMRLDTWTRTDTLTWEESFGYNWWS